MQQVDGGDPVQLTRDIGFCRDPAFSPDGGKIVVTCGVERGAVYVVPTLGGLSEQVGEGEWPRFSPDGSQISFVRPLGSGLAPDTVWISQANGGPRRELKHIHQLRYYRNDIADSAAVGSTVVNGQLRLWLNGRQETVYEAADQAVPSPDGKHLLLTETMTESDI